jgi:cyclophilin family peptidyl-prolyl cis-trans isomerase
MGPIPNRADPMMREQSRASLRNLDSPAIEAEEKPHERCVAVARSSSKSAGSPFFVMAGARVRGRAISTGTR